tara:strand:- start:2164 stop:2985 length:822 start_codon:yes stop_codon:yes gene_type:complete
MLFKKYFENINDWLENECLNILQENNYVLIKEHINNNIVEAEFKNIFEIIEYPLNVPKIDNKYIYNKINIISDSYSYSGHLYSINNISNDKPNTPRTDFLYNIIKLYFKDITHIFEIGCGVAFIPAYILNENINIKYTGIDPQKEVYKENLKLYSNYKNIDFINDFIHNKYINSKYDLILHCHPWIKIPNLYDIYENIAYNIKPKYFVLQTYGNKDNNNTQVKNIYINLIHIFLKGNYEKVFQIYDLNINNIFFNNKWFLPTNQTIIIFKYKL